MEENGRGCIERATKYDPGDIHLTTPRETVELHLPDGRVLEGPRNAPVGDFFNAVYEPGSPPVVGAIVSGELRELTFPLKIDCRAKPVTMGEADGMRIYRRSLTFLLETAFSKLFPGAFVTVDHSVSSGGYYCQVSSRPPLSKEELEKLETRMRDLVQDNLPFTRKEVPLAEAIQYFKKQHAEDKVRLLTHRQKNYLTLYQLEDNFDYHHGYMVPSTGYLCWFNLVPAGDGFILRFPRRHAPTELLPMPEYPKLITTFRQYGNWLQRLGISSVGALNDAIQAERIREVILVSEALQEQRVTEIARQIAERSDRVKAVLIAGPSSSGKTTFSKRLSVQLLACGVAPFPLEMDNYFVDRDLTPRDKNGDFDFEHIGALDTERLSSDVSRLIAGEEVQLPHYNFITGQREPGEVVHLSSGEMIILEGIHGLNPALLASISSEQTFRVYVSALTQLNLDRHNRVSTTDTRLIRRIARDARERGYTAKITIQRWESVRRGEKNYIFPYQENADVMFNSALAYELSALKPVVEPLLRQVPFGTQEYIEAKRLLAFLEWFLPLDPDLIPDNSILKEFLGNSILRDFKLWHNGN
jgi:uridine kinase